MSDYHLDEIYAGCQQSLMSLSNYGSNPPYYRSHPQYAFGGDLTEVKYAYVQIAYKCTRHQGEGGNSMYGWAILNNFTPLGLGGKPARASDAKSHTLRFADNANGPRLFKKGSTLVGCWLIFSSKETHTSSGSLPMWQTVGQNSPMCPTPDKNNSTEERVVVYTSPVISIEGQCREWGTYNHLLKAWDKKAATYRYNNAGQEMPPEQYQAGLAALEKIANRYAYRLRKYLYGVLCPCHKCTDIDKGAHIAWNNCVPCLCKPSTTHSCWDPQTIVTGTDMSLTTGAFVPCPTQDKYDVKMRRQCIKCKPKEIYVAKHGYFQHETFCPGGTVCKNDLKVSTMSACQFGGTLVPVFDPTCIKVKDVKKLVTEVNSLVKEAHAFRRAYLNKNPNGKVTIQWYDKKSGNLASEEIFEENPAYKPWTDQMKLLTLSNEIKFKTIVTTCPPLITVWTSTSFSLLVQQLPEKYKTTTVSYKVAKFPPECTCDDILRIMDKCDTICMCDGNQCISAKEMHHILVKISTKLEEMLQSLCLPYRMVARKSFTAPTDSWHGPITPGDTVTCSAKSCLTTFPKNCNCIRKPVDGATYTDDSIFKCGHAQNKTLTQYQTFESVDWRDGSTYTLYNSGPYTSIDSNCCGITWPCAEDWFNGGFVTSYEGWRSAITRVAHNIWHYQGWQMMGQISLADYIKKYFGYSWNAVPSCCHGTDCLSQWHFEILWRVTQALLRGHYDQYQGGVQQLNVIYRFGMCGPPDCGYGPWPRSVHWAPPEQYIPNDWLSWEAPTCNANPIIQSASLPVMKWHEMGLDGKMTVEGTKYWLKRSAKPYNRSYSAINVPEESDKLMEKDDHIADVNIMVDPHTSNDPVVQLQCCIIKLISARWYMKDQVKDWDKVLLEKAILSGKGVRISDISSLFVSLVVDGLLDHSQLDELIEAIGLPYSHRIYSLLLNVDRLRGKALGENDHLSGKGMIVDRQELETVVNDYVVDTMRLGSSLMSPDILYDNRNELVKPFPEDSEFREVVEESNSPSNEGCSSCQLNRVKREMYEAFIKDLYTLKDDVKMRVLNHWTDTLPTVTTLRVVEKMKYRNVGRHELVPKVYKDNKCIVLDVQMAIGDVLAATAAVKTLKSLYPEYRVWITSSCPDVWKNNPLIEKGTPPDDAVKYVLGCPTSAHQNSRNSFVHQYWKALYQQLFDGEVEFSKAEAKPDLYLNRLERAPGFAKAKFGINGPYWVVVCGYKSDHPLKHWGPQGSADFYQKVIDATPHIQWVQMGKNDDDHHTHIPLKGVINLLGHTNHNLRDMLALIAHAEGVLCPNTCYQHFAAAFPNVRCVTIGGAREPKHWLDYSGVNPKHVYINTIGKLPCALVDMCKDPGTHFKNECSNRGNSGAPKCMEMITPDEIVEWIRKLT